MQALGARFDAHDTALDAINTRLDAHTVELKVIGARLDHVVTKGEFYRAIGAAVLAIVGLTTGLVVAGRRVVA